MRLRLPIPTYFASCVFLGCSGLFCFAVDVTLHNSFSHLGFCIIPVPAPCFCVSFTGNWGGGGGSGRGTVTVFLQGLNSSHFLVSSPCLLIQVSSQQIKQVAQKAYKILGLVFPLWSRVKKPLRTNCNNCLADNRYRVEGESSYKQNGWKPYYCCS